MHLESRKKIIFLSDFEDIASLCTSCKKLTVSVSCVCVYMCFYCVCMCMLCITVCLYIVCTIVGICVV